MKWKFIAHCSTSWFVMSLSSIFHERSEDMTKSLEWMDQKNASKLNRNEMYLLNTKSNERLGGTPKTKNSTRQSRFLLLNYFVHLLGTLCSTSVKSWDVNERIGGRRGKSGETSHFASTWKENKDFDGEREKSKEKVSLPTSMLLFTLRHSTLSPPNDFKQSSWLHLPTLHSIRKNKS